MVHVPVTDPRAEYIRMLQEGKSTEAYDFLLENQDILDNMTMGELARDYRRFRKQVILNRIPGLARILKERIFGEDSRDAL